MKTAGRGLGLLVCGLLVACEEGKPETGAADDDAAAVDGRTDASADTGGQREQDARLIDARLESDGAQLDAARDPDAVADTGAAPDASADGAAARDAASVPDAAPAPDAAPGPDAAPLVDAAPAPDGAEPPSPDAAILDAAPDASPEPDAACRPAPERCDGEDSDCDGLADEDFPGLGAPCAAGVGACRAAGEEACAPDGSGTYCTARPSAPDVETCNGDDDDCDGEIDEETVRECYSGPLGTVGVGLCASGTQDCVDGAFSPCLGEVLPAVEACAGLLDESCDGAVNEGCQCEPGEVRPCGDDAGECVAGEQRCDAGGRLGECEGAVGPDDEVCNGLDDDCDGETDEGTDEACYDGPEGTLRVGVCRGGVRACDDGAPAAVCEGQVTPAGDDRCDGADEDCDGATDEDVDVMPTACGVGRCAAQGELRCVEGVLRDSCRPGAAAADTTCDGVDDDCDGRVDEAYAAADVQCGQGACAAVGTRRCVEGRVVESCTPGMPAPSDATCDGIDEDCDGRPDENFVVQATRCGQGTCAAVGERRCEAARVVDTCRPGPVGPQDTICDGRDTDCDGRVDESYVVVATQCGVGACAARGERRCLDGAPRDTCVAGQPAAEVCDGQDNDCDNFADDGCAYSAAEVQGIFSANCAGCHTGGGASGGLRLDNFYDTTVNVRAGGAPLDRIEPGNRQTSYIWHKLRGTQADVGGVGARMPRGGAALAPEIIERFALWIDAGAPR